jgi:hypothetical protein
VLPIFGICCVEGRERKLDGVAKMVGRLCVHLPAALSASEFQGADRQKPRFSQSCAPRLALSLSRSLLLGRRRCSEEKRRGISLSEVLDANSLVRSESFCGEEFKFFSSFFFLNFLVFCLRIWVVKADELKKREQATWP